MHFFCAEPQEIRSMTDNLIDNDIFWRTLPKRVYQVQTLPACMAGRDPQRASSEALFFCCDGGVIGRVFRRCGCQWPV